MRDPVRLRFALCCALLLGVGVAFASMLGRGLRLDTDILGLLPSSAQDAGVAQAQVDFAARSASRLSLLVGAADAAQARAGAVALAHSLRESGAFEDLQSGPSTGLAEVARAYAPYRAGLLSAHHRQWLRTGDPAALHDEALRTMYSPHGFASPLSAAEDPLGILSAFLQDMVQAPGRAQPDRDMFSLVDGDTTWFLVLARTRESPFSLEAQRRVMDALDEGERALRRAAPEARLLRSGVVLHASAAATRATMEMSLFGTLSTLAVVALIAFTFRSLQPLVLSLVSLGLGTIAGLWACQHAFGKVHLITLVFGTSLIGVAVDYSLHFFSDQFRQPVGWNGRAALRHVGPSIFMGHLAAAIGYATLLVAPLPGVRQMALYSVVGLAVACATVLCLFPVLVRRGRAHEPVVLRLAHRLSASALRFRWTAPHLLVAVLLLAFAAGGIARLRAQDDVRLMQSSPAALVAEEREVNRLLDARFDSRFFLVRGADAEQVLQRDERLREALAPLIADGGLGGEIALSRALPSMQRQQADRELLLRQVYGPQGLASNFMRELGADAPTAERASQVDARAPLLDLPTGLAMPSSQPLRLLWLGDLAGGAASVVSLRDVRDVSALRNAAAGLEGVVLVDRIGEISDLLRAYRETATGLMLAVYALILALLALRYGIGGALVTLLPPAAAALLSLAFLGWIGSPLSLFNVLALLLVLGMGVDYAVFLREGRRAQPTVLLAIGLSALTTLFSFGLLALSSTPFIRAIGLTLAPGIALIFLLAVWFGPAQAQPQETITA